MKERPILFNGDMVRAVLAGQKTQTRRPKFRCPYGQPGDRLWVRETFAYAQDGTVVYRASMVGSPWDAITRRAITWHPSIHMPRAICRIILGITDVRVERVQDIHEEDAIAEGIDPRKLSYLSGERAVTKFSVLWNSLYAADGLGWDVNPWAWVVTFKRVENQKCPKN